MTGRTHDLAAVTSLIAYVAFQPLIKMSLATAVTVISANLIGAFLPDIDQPTAHFWRKIPAGSILGRIISPLLGHHRMISHSLVGLYLVYWGSGLLLSYIHTFLLVDMDLVRWSLMIGYISHLLMDTITKEGVPWLFPVPYRFGIPPVKFFRVTTGSITETLLVYPGLILCNAYLVYSHYSKWIDFVTHYVKR